MTGHFKPVWIFNPTGQKNGQFGHFKKYPTKLSIFNIFYLLLDINKNIGTYCICYIMWNVVGGFFLIKSVFVAMLVSYLNIMKQIQNLINIIKKLLILFSFIWCLWFIIIKLSMPQGPQQISH